MVLSESLPGDHLQRGIEHIARSTDGLREPLGVRQDIDEDCAENDVDHDLGNSVHLLLPNLEDDDREDNGHQHRHPIDRTEVELHLFLLSPH
jgi:hypothetical protein